MNPGRFLAVLRGRFSQALLASIVVPASLVAPSGHGTSPPVLSILALPTEASVSADTAYGRGSSGSFYFLSPSRPRYLARLLVEHPMGAKDLWRETWSIVSIPPHPDFRIRAAAVGLGHLFLAGERKGGGAVVSSYQVSMGEEGGKETMSLTGQVDYFPDAADVSIRLLYLDWKARILWLGYDSGQVESGLPFLVLHDRILWTDRAGYIPLPSETALSAGPPPLLVPRATVAGNGPCFSCRFYLTGRMSPKGGEIKNMPVHAPDHLDSSMGMLPAGQGMGIFLGHRSNLCRIPETGSSSGIAGCLRLSGSYLPVAGRWWGNRLVYLFPPGAFQGNGMNRWVVATINPAELYAYVLTHASGTPLDMLALIRKKGDLVPLPAGARPRRRTLSVDGRDLILFGKTHLYRIMPGS